MGAIEDALTEVTAIHRSGQRQQGESVAEGLMTIRHALIFSSIAVNRSCNF